MIPALVITILVVASILLYRSYKLQIRKEKILASRKQELHEAEQTLQNLQDKKKVENVNMTAAELQNKILKLRNKIEKEKNKNA